MKNTSADNLSMHTQEAAVIAHALCVINNVYFDGKARPERAVALALFHDAAEIFTGDMPTPVKYSGVRMKKAYEEIEEEAKKNLLGRLPEEMRDIYADLMTYDGSYEYRLMKQADKICAYLKCVEERKAGSKEFLSAERSILKELEETALPETALFMSRFLPSYELTLDETEKI